MARHRESLRVGVVIERRQTANRWQDHVWRAVAVIPGAPDIASPCLLLRNADGAAQYHAATLDIELFSGETEGYRTNLSQDQPVVYAIMTAGEDGPEAMPMPSHVTVCPYEAQDYLDGSDVVVEPVPMPEVVLAWVQRYVERYHVDQPFEKRRRRPHRANLGEGSAGEGFDD